MDAVEQLRGAWYVLVSNRRDWRIHSHPRVDCEPLADGRLAIATRFRGLDLIGREHERVVQLIAVATGSDGCFEVRARLRPTRFRVAAIDIEQRWAAIWFDHAGLGSSIGLDVLTRDPWIPQARLDAILAVLAEHPFLGSRCGGLFATTQHWIPPEPFRF